jgi:hypothetical protein
MLLQAAPCRRACSTHSATHSEQALSNLPLGHIRRPFQPCRPREGAEERCSELGPAGWHREGAGGADRSCSINITSLYEQEMSNMRGYEREFAGGPGEGPGNCRPWRGAPGDLDHLPGTREQATAPKHTIRECRQWLRCCARGQGHVQVLLLQGCITAGHPTGATRCTQRQLAQATALPNDGRRWMQWHGAE